MRAPALCALLPILLALTSPARGQEPPPEPAPPTTEPAPAPPPPVAPVPEAVPEPPPPVAPEELPAPTSSDPTTPEALLPEALPGSAEPPPPPPAGGLPPPAVSSGGIAPPPARRSPEEGRLIDPLAPTDLEVGSDATTLDPARTAATDTPTSLPTDVEDTGLREPTTPAPGRTELSGAGSVADSFGLTTLPGRERGVRLTPWLRLNPVIRAEMAYDDNVFRVRSDSTDDKEADLELVGSLGLTLVARPLRPLYLSLSYSLLYRSFASETSVASLDHFVRLAGAWTTRRFNVGTNLSLAKLARPDDPRFGGAQAERVVLEGSFSGQVQVWRTVGLRTEEAILLTDYDNQDNLDQLSLRVNLLAVAQVARPVSVVAGIGVRDLRYTSSQAVNPDLRLFSPQAGVEVLLGTRLTLSLRLGYEFGQITDDRGQTGLDAPSGFTISTSAAWQINPRWRLTGALNRQITTAIVSSSQTNTRFELELRRRFGPRIEAYVRGSVELQEPQNSSDDLLALRGGCGVDWRLRDWVSVGAYATYLTSDSDARGSFEVFRAGVQLTFTP